MRYEVRNIDGKYIRSFASLERAKEYCDTHRTSYGAYGVFDIAAGAWVY